MLLRNRFNYLIITLFLNGFISTILFAQELHFQQYTVEDGLSYFRIPRASNLIQDRQGFIWIPSFNGLNRFDGREFRVFKNDPTDSTSIGNNTSLGMSEAADGKIWVSVGRAGLNIYDPETGIFERLKHNPNDSESLCHNFLERIHRDAAGDMWLVSSQGVICRCKKGTRKFKTYQLPRKRIGKYCLLSTKDGGLYVGGAIGLYQYQAEKDTFILHIPYPNAPENRQLNNVRAMMEGPNGEIWVSSMSKGQKIFDPQTATFRAFPKEVVLDANNAVVGLIKGRHQNYWIGERNALLQYNPEKEITRTFKQQSTDNTTISGWTIHLLEDKAGSLWVGTGRKGIGVTHNVNNPFHILPKNNYKQELIPLDDRHLLLPTNTGILTYDIIQQKIVGEKLPPILKNAFATWLRKSPTGDLWWRDSKQEKVFSYHLKTGKTRSLDLSERFEMDTKGNVWFQQNLQYYDVAQEKMIPIYQELVTLDSTNQLPENIHITWLTIDSQDRVWYSTNGGGFFYIDPQQKKLRQFVHQPNNSNSVAVGSIYRIQAGSNGWIYCRTNTALSIYQPERDTFINLTEADGMLNTQYLASMEDDKGDWWFATTEGLSKLRIPELQFQNFDVQDGLPGGVFNWGKGKDKQGNIYFFKNDELLQFHPDSLSPNTYVAPIIFTDFFLNQQRVKPKAKDSILTKNIHFQESLILDHTQTDFGFSFVSPNFYKSDKIQYYYQLVGYDKDWVAIGNKLAVHLTNIPTGNYAFKVKAKTEAGFWTKETSSIKLTILPPWWETKWAYLLYTLLFFSLIWAIWQYELKRLHNKNEALRLTELNQLKTRLYTNITHEFRTPLTVIQGMATQMKGDPLAKRLIRRNSKNLLHLVNQLLDMSKLEAGQMTPQPVRQDIVYFLNYLTESFQSYANTKEVKLVLYTEEEELIMNYDPEKMQHIIANLLSNAIKFTEAKGKIFLQVSRNPQLLIDANAPLLQIKIKDNGIGIRATQLRRIFDRFYQVDDADTRSATGTGIGLALAKELVEVLGGAITVKSELGKGTQFTLLIPSLEMPIAPENKSETLEMNQLEPFYPETISIPIGEEVQTSKSSTASTVLPLLLLIEDNADIVVYIKTCLQHLYQIAVAYDGEAGIAKALDLVPDIIISDVMMPKKNGFEVTQILKQTLQTSHIPIILLTAKTTFEDKIAGLERGADAYLEKPFQQKELEVRLQQLLALRKQLQLRYTENPLPTKTITPDLKIEDGFVQNVKAIILEHLTDTDFNVQKLCAKIFLSRQQVHRKLIALTGLSTSHFIRAIRLQAAKELLKTTDQSITQIAFAVGFKEVSYFSKVFTLTYGQSPSEFRKRKKE